MALLPKVFSPKSFYFLMSCPKIGVNIKGQQKQKLDSSIKKYR
jgi:hypothetical protein